MKKVFISSVIVLAVVMSVAAQNAKNRAAKPATKTAVKPKMPGFKNLLDSFSYAAGYNVATNMKAQGISRINIEMMQKGLDDVFKNNNPVLTPAASNECMQKQLGIFAAEKSEADKSGGIAFLEANKKRKGVITLPSGLQYEVIKSGDVNGPLPKIVDTVEVNYIGTLIDGKGGSHTQPHLRG